MEKKKKYELKFNIEFDCSDLERSKFRQNKLVIMIIISWLFLQFTQIDNFQTVAQMSGD